MDKKAMMGPAPFTETLFHPLEPQLPDIPNVDENVIHNVLVNYLQEKRFGSTSSRRNTKRQRLDIQPGKSITGPESSSDEEQETASVLEENSDDAVSEQLEEQTEHFSVENYNLTIGAYMLVNVAGGSRKKT
nr:unnamed protein product [Callosobruchus analis]